MNSSLKKVWCLPLFVAGSFFYSLSYAQESYVLNQCFECHGKVGRPGAPGAAAIGGAPKEQLIEKLEGYRKQRVEDSVMSRGTHDLSDEDIDIAAEYFSKQRKYNQTDQ